MNRLNSGTRIRWFYLIIGVAALLLAGMIYMWSILKVPLADSFGWTSSQLARNYTITMCCFCLGGLLSTFVTRRIGAGVCIMLSGILAGLGFVLTSLLSGSSIWLLYATYGLAAGLGIGMAYITIITTVSAWFPDRKGLCSGCLMMGFGVSALVLSNLTDGLILTAGWRAAYRILGISLGLVLVIAGCILRPPAAGTVLPQPAPRSGEVRETPGSDLTTKQMMSKGIFWRAFVCFSLLTAVGSTVISFARDLSVSVGARPALATTLVGVLSVCSGVGRILTGALFDMKGRRTTMLASHIITVAATAVLLMAVFVRSVPLCIAGLCLTGLSYGSCPTLLSASTAAFFGARYFASNFGVMNCALMCAALIAFLCNALISFAGNYAVAFAALLLLTVGSWILSKGIHPSQDVNT